MNLCIRQAASDDALRLKVLGSDIYRAHFRHMWHSESELNAHLEHEYALSGLKKSLQDENIKWYIAEIEQAIGFAKLTWEATIPDTNIHGTLLNKLYFAPTKTGKKYGQFMFERIIKDTRRHGEKFLWLEVLEQNERACNFYKKQGMHFIKDIVFETSSQQSIVKIMGMPI